MGTGHEACRAAQGIPALLDRLSEEHLRHNAPVDSAQPWALDAAATSAINPKIMHTLTTVRGQRAKHMAARE